MTPSDRALLDAFLTGREDLLSAAADVPPGLRTTPFVGHWHLGHLLAHLVGWDYANVEAVEALRTGRLPAFYAHYEPDWATFNAGLVERYRDDDWQAMRNSLLESQTAVLAALRRLDGRLSDYTAAWQGRRVSLAGILRAAIRDEHKHLAQIPSLQQSIRLTND